MTVSKNLHGLPWWLGLLASGLLCAAAATDAPRVLDVGKFSAGRPGSADTDGWKPLTFKKIPKPTAYELVQEGDTVVVKAVSEAAASGLTKAVRIDPSVFPVVHWRW